MLLSKTKNINQSSAFNLIIVIMDLQIYLQNATWNDLRNLQTNPRNYKFNPSNFFLDPSPTVRNPKL